MAHMGLAAYLLRFVVRCIVLTRQKNGALGVQETVLGVIHCFFFSGLCLVMSK